MKKQKFAAQPRLPLDTKRIKGSDALSPDIKEALLEARREMSVSMSWIKSVAIAQFLGMEKQQTKWETDREKSRLRLRLRNRQKGT